MPPHWRLYNFCAGFIFYFLRDSNLPDRGKQKCSIAVFSVWTYLTSPALTLVFYASSLVSCGSFTAGKCLLQECFRLLRRGCRTFGHVQHLLASQLDKIIVVSLMNREAAGIYTVGRDI